MMNYECKVETGIQLFARSGYRPRLKGIGQGLFFYDLSNSPDNGDTLEISGDASTGKTLYITQMIAQCILPVRVKAEKIDVHVGGFEAGAVLINTDHHFQIAKVVQIMEQRLSDCFNSCGLNPNKTETARAIENFLESSLKKLLILNCYDSAQLFATFHSFEKILFGNVSYALVVLDSASSFYWQDVCSKNVISKRMDSYLISVLSTLEKCVKGSNVLTVYTRPRYFFSKKPSQKCEDKKKLESVEEEEELQMIVDSDLTSDPKNPHLEMSNTELYSYDDDLLSWKANQVCHCSSCVNKLIEKLPKPPKTTMELTRSRSLSDIYDVHSQNKLQDGFKQAKPQPNHPFKIQTCEKDTMRIVSFGNEILSFQGSIYSLEDIAPTWKKDCRMWLWKSVRASRKRGMMHTSSQH